MPDPPERDWLSPIEARNSASPTPSPVDKSRPFYQRRDVSPLTSNGQSCWQPVDILRRPPETGPVRSLRGRQREVSTARQRSRAAASSPDRSAGANRRPHGTDQPEAAPCGPTRKGDRTRDDHREDRPDDGGAVRSEAVGGPSLVDCKNNSTAPETSVSDVFGRCELFAPLWGDQ